MEVDYAPFNWTQPNSADDAVEVSNSPGEYAMVMMSKWQRNWQMD